jgi:predicted AAA+ superfamily ATPase
MGVLKMTFRITKEKKLYLFDYAGIDSPAVKFENMVALELFRAVSNWNDLGLGNFALHYIRNREKEEVDFLISNNHNPLILIETKLSDDHASKSLKKFQKVLNIPAVQLVNRSNVCKIVSNNQLNILIISADHWLSLLP